MRVQYCLRIQFHVVSLCPPPPSPPLLAHPPFALPSLHLPSKHSDTSTCLVPQRHTPHTKPMPLQSCCNTILSNPCQLISSLNQTYKVSAQKQTDAGAEVREPQSHNPFFSPFKQCFPTKADAQLQSATALSPKTLTILSS